MSAPYRRAARWFSIPLLVALAAGCGTQLDASEIREANSFSSDEGATAGQQPAAPDPTAPLDPAAGAAVVPGAPAAPAATGSGAVGSPGTTTTGTAPGTASGGKDKPTKTGTGPATPITSKAPIVGSVGCASPGAPIDVGQVGTFSGLVGGTMYGFKTGASLWAKAVNAAGGLGCRPVRLFQADDQSSPSVAQSVIQDLVQNKHVSALIGVASVLNMPAVQAAVNKFKVPAIGGAGVERQFNYSPDPLMFSQGGSGLPAIVGASLTAAEVAGGKNVGILYCVEAQLCTDFNNVLGGKEGLFAKYGMNPVFQQSVSLAQASFTSACQNAKNAKVDVLWLGTDGSAAQRAIRDCTAINYHPQYSASPITTSAAVAADPNVRKAGVFTGAGNVPMLSNPNAGSAAFQDAVAKYLGSAPVDQAVMAGWASGQMYAAAINALAPNVRAGAITSDVVLKGLWSLKDETLNGLAPPMNFPQGKPYPIVACYYVLRIGEQGYTAPDNGKQKCL